MAHSFTWEPHGLLWEWTGDIGVDELITANSELVGYPQFETIHYIIWDARGIGRFLSQVDKAVKNSTSFAIMANQYNRDVKVAFVVSDVDIKQPITDYIRQTQMALPHVQQQTFATLEAARTWVAAK